MNDIFELNDYLSVCACVIKTLDEPLFATCFSFALIKKGTLGDSQ